jgi:hypothetical protein
MPQARQGVLTVSDVSGRKQGSLMAVCERTQDEIDAEATEPGLG